MRKIRTNWQKIDIIGDIHGCWYELKALIDKLGYNINPDGLLEHDEGRKIVFVGDIVDKGPENWKCLDFVKRNVEDVRCFCIQGNHDNKLGRFFKGNPVKLGTNAQNTVNELKNYIKEGEYKEYSEFILDLPLYAEFDSGKVGVVHAAPSKYDHKVQKNVNLYSYTSGRRNKDGYPERIDWTGAYDRSDNETFVVYGHVMLQEPKITQKTAGIDTGCCVGNRLTAFRWPEKDVVSVKAESNIIKEEISCKKGMPKMKSFEVAKDITTMNLKKLLKNLKNNEEKVLSLIDEDDQLIKRKLDNGLVIANASNSLYMPEKQHQLYAKGIVFTRNPYKLVSLPLIKMFNHQNNECNVSDELTKDLEKRNIAIAVPQKEDGTMIQLFEYNGKVYLSTRGVLEGQMKEIDDNNFNYIKKARQIIERKHPELLKPSVVKNKTLILELICPENRIITNYGGREDLILLSIFDQSEFRYRTHDKMWEWAGYMTSLSCPKMYAYATPSMLSEQIEELRERISENDKIVEGCVICFEKEGEIVHRIKVKTERYLSSFKTKYLCNYKNTVEKLLLHPKELNEDEFIDHLKEENELEEEIEQDYRDYYRQYREWRHENQKIKAKVKNIVKEFDKNTNKELGSSEYYKEAALSHQKQHPDIFGLLMTEHRMSLTADMVMRYNKPHASFGSTLVKYKENQ